MVFGTRSAQKPSGASRGDDANHFVWRWAAGAAWDGRRHPPCWRKGALMTAAHPVPNRSGRSPWPRLVREVTVGCGELPRGGFFSQPVLTETFVRAVVADGRSGSVWLFQAPAPITPPAGSVFLGRGDASGRRRHGAPGLAPGHLRRRAADRRQAVGRRHARSRSELDTDHGQHAACGTAGQPRRARLHPPPSAQGPRLTVAW